MAQLEKLSIRANCRMNPSSATYRSASRADGCGSPILSVPVYSEDGEQGGDGQSSIMGVSVFAFVFIRILLGLVSISLQLFQVTPIHSKDYCKDN
jgi:hypothetical protein